MRPSIVVRRGKGVRCGFSLVELLLAFTIFSLITVATIGAFRLYHTFLAEKSSLDRDKALLFVATTEELLPSVREVDVLSTSPTSLELDLYDGCSVLISEKLGEVEFTYSNCSKPLYPFRSFKVKDFSLTEEDDGSVEITITPVGTEERFSLFVKGI